MIEIMTWWERQSNLIPLSWFGFGMVFLWLWRLEEKIPDGIRALNYLPLRASVLLLLVATLVHYLLYRWRSIDEGWLWAMWCSLLYAAIIVSMIVWRLSMTTYI